ncbi:hypothetical protein CLOSTMETH_02962 [[Clostridium] methylpentosum DSM 5476]|uniref:Uncharacterized protein n=1 Tax=[Clostridium] methylpentosum DSM 5476 TaxID=537013 RepID=C0EGG9_9FIRM|nr:hypothetical protein CLOSTMETH_02962 [[Clostridium] methylpentosum DSM 5476]
MLWQGEQFLNTRGELGRDAAQNSRVKDSKKSTFRNLEGGFLYALDG